MVRIGILTIKPMEIMQIVCQKNRNSILFVKSRKPQRIKRNETACILAGVHFHTGGTGPGPDRGRGRQALQKGGIVPLFRNEIVWYYNFVVSRRSLVED
jgi:hypothetical protein